jgi:DNA-binding CsgD family transcriptional regulator
LEHQHAGTPAGERISGLILLKSEPHLTIVQAASRLGKSRRAFQRWLEAYRRGGIAELLNPAIGRGRPRRLGTSELQALRDELGRVRMTDLSEVQQWVRMRFGAEFSTSGIWNLLRRDINAVPRGWVTIHEARDRQGTTGNDESGTAISERVISFLNALPTTADVTRWVLSFREALARFLGDVDRVSINVNTNCNLADPDSFEISQVVTQHVPTSDGVRSRISVSVSRNERPSDRLLRDAERAGVPIEEFHEPNCFDYYFGGRAYIGTVILWRRREESPISESTTIALTSLEPFILFALSDIVARNKAEQPVSAAFTNALERMNVDADLSPQEQRIVILQLMGHSYKEMADVLSVTVDTVKKHFKQIHRKTNTRSQSELFAKYFTFRLHE